MLSTQVHEIAQGTLPCTDSDVVKLIAVRCQHEQGDYSSPAAYTNTFIVSYHQVIHKHTTHTRSPKEERNAPSKAHTDAQTNTHTHTHTYTHTHTHIHTYTRQMHSHT